MLVKIKSDVFFCSNRILHSYGDVTIAGLHVCSVPHKSLSREYFNLAKPVQTMLGFLRFHPKDSQYLVASCEKNGAVRTYSMLKSQVIHQICSIGLWLRNSGNVNYLSVVTNFYFRYLMNLAKSLHWLIFKIL